MIPDLTRTELAARLRSRIDGKEAWDYVATNVGLVASAVQFLAPSAGIADAMIADAKRQLGSVAAGTIRARYDALFQAMAVRYRNEDDTIERWDALAGRADELIDAAITATSQKAREYQHKVDEKIIERLQGQLAICTADAAKWAALAGANAKLLEVKESREKQMERLGVDIQRTAGGDTVIGAPDFLHIFTEHCEREGYPSDDADTQTMLWKFFTHGMAAAQPVPEAAAQADSVGFDECCATGQSCQYGAYGREGEMQCKYCGKEQPTTETAATPAPVSAANPSEGPSDDKILDALVEALDVDRAGAMKLILRVAGAHLDEREVV